MNPIKGPLGVLTVIFKLYKQQKEFTQDLEVKALWSIPVPQSLGLGATLGS